MGSHPQCAPTHTQNNVQSNANKLPLTALLIFRVAFNARRWSRRKLWLKTAAAASLKRRWWRCQFLLCIHLDGCSFPRRASRSPAQFLIQFPLSFATCGIGSCFSLFDLSHFRFSSSTHLFLAVSGAAFTAGGSVAHLAAALSPWERYLLFLYANLTMQSRLCSPKHVDKHIFAHYPFWLNTTALILLSPILLLRLESSSSSTKTYTPESF